MEPSTNSNYFISGIKRNNTVKLYYELYGNGPEKIMILPGIISTSESWKKQIDSLIKDYPGINSDQSRFQIASFHYRGIGKSDNLYSNLMHDYSMDALDLLDHLNWEKANLVSISFGSQVAFNLAINSRDRIDSLLLTSLKGPSDYYVKEIDFLKNSILEKNVDNFLESFFSNDFLEYPSDKYPDKNLKQVLYKSSERALQKSNELPKSIINQHFDTTLGFKLNETHKTTIQNRSFPVTLIHGTKDTIFPIDDSHNSYKFIKPDNYILFDGCAHNVLNERQKEFTNAIVKTINYSKFRSSNNPKSEITIHKNTFSKPRNFNFNFPKTKINKINFLINGLTGMLSKFNK